MESVKNVTYGKSTQTYSSDGRKIKVLDVGGKNGERSHYFYPDSEVCIIDKIHGWDFMKKGLPHGEWDFILANHFLEHIDDPDFFLDECKKVMKHYTVLNIGMPNLSSWYNRILFFLGYIPQSYEISYRKIYGRFIKDGTDPGGHIRLMNIPSFIEMIENHGFKIISVEGEKSAKSGFLGLIDALITKFNKNLSSCFRVKCTI